MSTSAQPTLQRLLGPIDGAALVVANVIGIGIFTTPGIVAAIAPHPLAALAAWLVGGFLAFAGAAAYSELAARHPRAGGEYAYLREAFGPVAGFLSGWTSFVAGFSGAIAAGAMGLASYLAPLLHIAPDTTLSSAMIGPLHIMVTPLSLIAITIVVVISAVHALGVRPGRVLQNSLALLQVAVIVVFIVLGFVVGRGSSANFTASAGSLSAGAWLLALVPIMFTYSGWNAAAYVAEEVREPERNVPRALALGTAIVIALYLLLNALFIYALPVADLRGKVQVASAAADALFAGSASANRIALFMTALVSFALASGVGAMLMAGPRVYFAMARDGVFPAAVARVNPRFKSPATAVIAQAAWCVVLILSGTFEQLLIYTGFAVVLFSASAVAALFVLRRRNPDAPFRSPGYPVLPALFLVASAAMLVSAIAREPKPSLAGLAIMLAGLPVYFWFRRKQKKQG